MKKRLLSLLLILCLCAALLPVTALAAETTVANEEELRTALSTGGTVKLSGEIKLAAVLEINNTVTLDLNGIKSHEPSLLVVLLVVLTQSTLGMEAT